MFQAKDLCLFTPSVPNTSVLIFWHSYITPVALLISDTKSSDTLLITYKSPERPTATPSDTRNSFVEELQVVRKTEQGGRRNSALQNVDGDGGCGGGSRTIRLIQFGWPDTYPERRRREALPLGKFAKFSLCCHRWCCEGGRQDEYCRVLVERSGGPCG